MKAVYHLKTVAETDAFGRTIGARLKGGETLELVSDLGGGKTTLTRGIVAGAGSSDRVASPTFTVTKQYRVTGHAANQLQTIVHADLYRLQDPGLIAHELGDIIGDPTAVLIVEWAGIVADALPKERITIELAVVSESGRDLTVTYPEKYAYIVEDLQ